MRWLSPPSRALHWLPALRDPAAVDAGNPNSSSGRRPPAATLPPRQLPTGSTGRRRSRVTVAAVAHAQCVFAYPRLSPRGDGLVPYRCAGSLTPTNSVLEKSMIENKEQFKLVYKFPGIKYCRIFSRMKLLQTALTIVILPPVYHLYLQEQVSQGFVLYVTGTACFAATMLYGISYFLRRMIGLMYLNEAGTVVKVAHLTFWGRKKEIYCPVENVMTLGDTGDTKNEVLLQFKQHNSTQVLYFTLTFGHIVDKQKFAQIFGGF
ncbi:transmembrane protein 186 isoform X1 [Gopherus evgoodei]|uniref:transmembrane protein 186 isoform X1 n=1 Tax=Gopherus evgoodei TaxID=1825980 RepID=UPI0011CF02A6|nr:transmembrane protein 186 isoform X1 [Gopherus evgoodei]